MRKETPRRMALSAMVGLLITIMVSMGVGPYISTVHSALAFGSAWLFCSVSFYAVYDAWAQS